MKPILHFVFSLMTGINPRVMGNVSNLLPNLKTSGTILYLLIFFSSKSPAQEMVHGPSVKGGGSTLEMFSFGVGYHFLKFEDDWGWSRPAHNYYIEYVPEYEAIGLSANVQYTLIFVKVGMEASFRSKNENNQAYLSFYPHLGFDLINGDLSFGPEVITYRSDNKFLGFKITLKVHPKLFNKGTNSLKLKRD